ncbi:hypothetical protein T10_9024 [Trichinella papuae]|uniref:Uncharacterized protein n=1 Tax=Trichinella papuae TaxID=268474 RepID=A0A0V1MD68_9BILA|nr:hypothetical protein T10_9024 [Trichinella papuae]
MDSVEQRQDVAEINALLLRMNGTVIHLDILIAGSDKSEHWVEAVLRLVKKGYTRQTKQTSLKTIPNKNAAIRGISEDGIVGRQSQNSTETKKEGVRGTSCEMYFHNLAGSCV